VEHDLFRYPSRIKSGTSSSGGCSKFALASRWVLNSTINSRSVGLGPSVRAFAVMLACLGAGACSVVLPYERSNAPVLTDRVVSQAVRAAFAEAKLPGAPEVSQIRAAHPVSPGDWLLCLRSSEARQQRLHYALYFTGSVYVRSQLAALVDRCDDDTYLPFVERTVGNEAGPPLNIR
jgi:hypothetical protein